MKCVTLTQVTKIKPLIQKKYFNHKLETTLYSLVSAHRTPKLKMQFRALAQP